MAACSGSTLSALGTILATLMNIAQHDLVKDSIYTSAVLNRQRTALQWPDKASQRLL